MARLSSKKPKTVSGYIAAAAPNARTKLRQVRAAVRKAAPGATESLKWNMPAVSYHRIVLMYAAFRNHISLFAMGATVKAFRKDLKGYKTGRGTIQLPLDKPIPLALVRRIAAYRAREVRERDAHWR